MTAICRCHSDDSLYGRLSVCWSCRHRSYDPGVGCERRKCGYVRSTDCTLLVSAAQGVLFSDGAA